MINGGDRQYVVAKVEMELQLFQDDVRFANFQLIAPEITVSKAATTQSLFTQLSSRRQISAAPTRSELQDILARFVNAYETGDANLFDALFSSDVQSNDHNNLQGIKEDYSKVFSNTSDRQMFIQNIDWTVDGNNAKGIGQLDAIVLPKDDGDTQLIKGQIKLVVNKSNNKLIITHFFHTSY